MKKKVKKMAFGGFAGLGGRIADLAKSAIGGGIPKSRPMVGPDDRPLNRPTVAPDFANVPRIGRPTPSPTGMMSPQALQNFGAGLKGMLASQRPMMKKSGSVKTTKMASGGKASSASKRADGIAQRGKTRGRMV